MNVIAPIQYGRYKYHCILTPDDWIDVYFEIIVIRYKTWEHEDNSALKQLMRNNNNNNNNSVATHVHIASWVNDTVA